MPTQVWHELGRTPGACTVCGADGTLTLGEVRARRSVVERVRRSYAPAPSRFATCGACGWRWSVRVSDSTPDVVRRRAPVERERQPGLERRGAGPAPVPPDRSGDAPGRPARRPGRDWTYPGDT